VAIHGSKQAKGCLKRSSAKTVWQLFKYSRNQLRTMAGPQTGYCHLKGYLHIWGHMGHFCARPFCIIIHSTSPPTSIFYSVLSGLSRGMATIFWNPGRLLTLTASNRNFELKKVTIIQFLLFGSMLYNWVTRWHSCLRMGATSRKVAGLIPEGVIGFFIDIFLAAASMLQNAFKVSNGSIPLKYSFSQPFCWHLDSAERAVASCHTSSYVPLLGHPRRAPNIYVRRPYTYSSQQLSLSMFTIHAHSSTVGRDSSVGIATRYRLVGP